MNDFDKLTNRFVLLIIGIVLFVILFVPFWIVLKFFAGLLIADAIIEIVSKLKE